MTQSPHPTIKLFGQTVPIGAGTVPTSPDSVHTTLIAEVVKIARKISDLGIFDVDGEDEHRTPTTTAY